MAQVIITGFMATGKTEVGRRLARTLGRPFVDTDGLVEASAGHTVPHIFAAEGEARFRELERAARVGDRAREDGLAVLQHLFAR